MQPDAATPSTAALDLLMRADALASAARAAIEAGDDEAVLALLDARGTVIDAAIDACGAMLRTAHTVDDLVSVSEAARRTVAIGVHARGAAIVARSVALEALAILDAGQQGQNEYQPQSPHGRIDVVL